MSNSKSEYFIMAVTSKTKAHKAKARASSSPKPKAAVTPRDAIGVLETDHREVDAHFHAFDGANGQTAKKALVEKICLALKVHTQVEEELLYPLARDKTGDFELLDEALVEHMAAKSLIAEIEVMQPSQALYDAKVKVLAACRTWRTGGISGRITR